MNIEINKLHQPNLMSNCTDEITYGLVCPYLTKHQKVESTLKLYTSWKANEIKNHKYQQSVEYENMILKYELKLKLIQNAIKTMYTSSIKRKLICYQFLPCENLTLKEYLNLNDFEYHNNIESPIIKLNLYFKVKDELNSDYIYEIKLYYDWVKSNYENTIYDSYYIFLDNHDLVLSDDMLYSIDNINDLTNTIMLYLNNLEDVIWNLFKRYDEFKLNELLSDLEVLGNNYDINNIIEEWINILGFKSKINLKNNIEMSD